MIQSYAGDDTVEMMECECSTGGVPMTPIPVHWPKTIKCLTLQNFSKPLIEGMLPPTLTRLTIENFDHPLLPGVLPSTLTHLSMEDFQQSLKIGSIPSSVTHLKMGLSKVILPGHLPSSLTHLVLGSPVFQMYTHELLPGSLPSKLEHLTFNPGYNQPIRRHVLPSSLTHLSLGRDFNQPIECHVLPPSLIRLDFGSSFDQLIKPGSLPASLRRLGLGYEYNRNFQAGSLPNQLTHITMGREYRNSPTMDTDAYTLDPPSGPLPPSLVHFELQDSFPSTPLPQSITHLVLHSIREIEPGMLPPALEYLELNLPLSSVDIAHGSLPLTLLQFVVDCRRYPRMEVLFHDPSIPPTLSNDTCSPHPEVLFLHDLINNQSSVSIITVQDWESQSGYTQLRRIDEHTIISLPMYKFPMNNKDPSIGYEVPEA
eukprot:gene12241-14342_t